MGDGYPVHEFRGVWIATVGNIDWPSNKHLTTAQQKLSLVHGLDQLQKYHFNAVIFQVRTSGDALYDSPLEPWSSYLTGTQGVAPKPYYDPLAFVIEEAHKRNIEVHAWFNPYRAKAGSSSKSGLLASHMCNRFSDSCYAYGSNLWMDPGDIHVLNHTIAVIGDVVTRYDVDGIHMDDYFYPYPVNDQDFPDVTHYQAYTDVGGTLPRDNWRRNNVNIMVEKVSITIKKIKPYVKFGISPFGIWKPGFPNGVKGLNAFSELYADSRKWLQEGSVDYLTPQLYWKIDPPAQSYPNLLNWWCDQNIMHRHIYAGNYASALDAKDWPVDELERQVFESRKQRSKNSFGNVFFSAKYFWDNIHHLGDRFLQDHIYSSPSLTPEMSWLNHTTLTQLYDVLTNVQITGRHLSWHTDATEHIRSFAMYKTFADGYKLLKVFNNSTRSFDFGITNSESGSYSLRVVGRNGYLGHPHEFKVTEVNVNLIG